MKAISGIRPSGRLHLGNYIGAIAPALDHDADILIADFHAPAGDADDLKRQLLAYVPAHKILRQSEVFNPHLYFALLEHAPVGLLRHMPQFKAKEQTAHMMTYPVLMAVDLVGYDLVIVGEDQRPHIELARDILPKIGAKCPEPIYTGKVMDLRDPTRKMSKSIPDSCLFLDEDPTRKINKAVTDAAGRANLEFIAAALGVEPCERNDEFKARLIAALVETVNS